MQRGFTLLELSFVLAIFGIAAALSLPNLWSATSRGRVALAANEVQSGLALARSHAIRLNHYVALRFEQTSTQPLCRYYVDGDGDGVRTADIHTGVDRPIGPAHAVGRLGARVRFGFPPGVRPRDPSSPGTRLGDLDDPIRFGGSNLAVFDPLGGATPGSVYLTDGIDELLVVRVLGRTGRVRVLRWDAARDEWTER